MPTSRFLANTAVITLDAIFKNSGADIRLHGLDRIPDQPVLYLANHFTRIETTFLPYLIKKHTGRYAHSLADDSFFSGNFGKLIQKLGAVSTADSDRDRILISALLNMETSVIIFPEGQMLKDKKIVQKGKYIVYNAGIRRAPHTGAARLALQAQMYREKIRQTYFDSLKTNSSINIDKFKEYFGLKDKDIDNILKNEIKIVPLNITYYPIRAKTNTINKLVEKMMKKVPERFEEELEVEGTMLLEGVDIDIIFGEPIPVKNFLLKSASAKKIIASPSLYLETEKMKNELSLKRIDFALMQKYMDSIYSLTTVNHDHIFAYLLSVLKSQKIDETDFKNRVNLIFYRINKLNLSYTHTSLHSKQTFLQTDDFHDKYNSFIEAATSDGLITVKNGFIIKTPCEFDRPYQFHIARQKNIIGVLKNEIEPLTDVTGIIEKCSKIPSFIIRGKTRKQFRKHDMEIFERDYTEFFSKTESKGKNIGKPFFRRRPFDKKGVILVHGYLSAPEEIRVVADALYKKGYAVYGARLRGHGTTPDDLAGRQWEEWYNSVNRAYVAMKNTVDDFVILGFSTGAGLALLQAANKGEKFKGVISISAPLKLQNITSNLSSAVVMWNNIMKKIKLKKGRFEFIPNDPENPHINYLKNPINGVNELEKLMNIVDDRLKDIKIPALVIQGSNDPVVNPSSADEIFKKIGTKDKSLCRVYADRHGIVRGDESEKVISWVLNFLEYVFNK